MVAKIKVGTSIYGALAYNSQKLDNNEAKILVTNKIFLTTNKEFDLSSATRQFQQQIPQRCNIKQPVIHISLNPHPDDKLTDEQLTNIAEEYMERLGYGNQPYIVFKHEDISRHHIHIVSLRVDSEGKKINDKFEFRRSKQITRDLEKKYGLHTAEKKQRRIDTAPPKVDTTKGDVKNQVESVIKYLSYRYNYLSFNEYRALLSLYNVTAEEVNKGVIYSATDDKGNKIGNPFKSSLFGKTAGYDALQNRYERSKEVIKDKKLAQGTKRRVSDALKNSTTKEEFKDRLKQSDIDVIFRENAEGRLYGTTFIDHNNHTALNGSRMGKELSANAIAEWFANPQQPQEERQTTENTISNEHETETQQPSNERGIDFEPITAGLFDLPNNSDDPEEERFRRRMKRKKSRRL